jgi:uncharacterized protein (DUF2164 family)
MGTYKKEVIIATAIDIRDYLLREKGVEVDEFDIAELINFNMGLYISNNVEDDTIDELEEYFTND